jgi:hypothetical protein
MALTLNQLGQMGGGTLVNWTVNYNTVANKLQDEILV